MDVSMHVHDERGLLALQGPSAMSVLQKLTSQDLSKFYFGQFARFDVKGAPCWVTRTGCGTPCNAYMHPQPVGVHLLRCCCHCARCCWSCCCCCCHCECSRAHPAPPHTHTHTYTHTHMMQMCISKAGCLLSASSRVSHTAPSTSANLLLCSYTGEDGFELSIPNESMVAIAEALVADPEVCASPCPPSPSPSPCICECHRM
jgi:Aminomethyltransferase folate-binding domain